MLENKKTRFDFHQNELFPVPGGGDKRDRTADLLNAIQALSQLSYTPMVLKPLIFLDFCVIRLLCSAGRFTGRLPSQLSYTPIAMKPVDLTGFLRCSIVVSCGLFYW